MTARIVMIGLDAGDLIYIRDRLGQLPHLRNLFKAGTCQPLESTAALLTGSVWPSFYCGALPDVHGIYHNLQWDWNKMCLRRVTDDWLPCTPFWHDLEAAGLRCITLDVPMTFAPQLKKGIEIVNWGAHDELGPFACNDSAVRGELLRRFGRHPMGGEVPVDKGPRKRARIQTELLSGIQKKTSAARWLLESQPCDLFITVFGETHRAGHILWPDVELGVGDRPLLEVYQAIDGAIGELLRHLSRDTLLILFALHGMETNRSQEHFVSPVLERLNSAWQGEKTTATRPQRSVMRWLRDHVPAPLQHAVADAVPAVVRDWVVDRSLAGGRDWASTPGFPLHADLNGYVRLNIRGRERDGVLATDKDANAYIDSLRQAFGSMRDPVTGAAIVQDVVVASEIFTGERAIHLPDIIVQWQPGANVHDVEVPGMGTFQGRRTTGRGGNHRGEGFCVLYRHDGALPEFSPPRHISDLAVWVRDLLFAQRGPLLASR